MKLDSIIDKVVRTGESVFVLCKTEQEWDRLRAAGYPAKRRVGKAADRVAFGKTETDGEIYLKVFLKKDPEVFIKDETGNLVLVEE